MGTTLSTLAPNPGATKKRKRIGRGTGSGVGKTGGKGQKGQKSRAGHHYAKPGFEGGQMPMQRRLPKRGFSNPFRVEAHPVNVGLLGKRFEAGAVVDVDALRASGLLPKSANVVKILGEGELSVNLTVRAHRFSKSARDKIEKAGGTVEVVADKQPPKSADAPAAE
jgi:large subunit ribosomal protein L15